MIKWSRTGRQAARQPQIHRRGEAQAGQSRDNDPDELDGHAHFQTFGRFLLGGTGQVANRYPDQTAADCEQWKGHRRGA
jgi:hypothetical protein